MLLVLTVALHAAAFTVDLFNPDEAFIGTQARVILDGGSVYDDTVDRKTPVVPYLYAGSFAIAGDDDFTGPRVLAMLAIALTAFLTLLEGRKRWGDRAGWAAGLICLFMMTAFLPGDGQAASFELFMLPATVGAVVLARRARWAGAGIAAGLGMIVKQTAGATLLPVAYLAVRATRSETDRRRRLTPLVLAVAASVMPVLVAALLVGVDEFLRWNVLGNGDFAAPPPFGEAVQLFFEQWGVWIGLNAPIVLLLLLAWRDRRRGAAGDDQDTDLWLWLLGAVLATAVGWRFYGHYFLQLAPAASLLVAGVLARRSERVRLVSLAATGAIAAGCAIGAFVADPADIIRPSLYKPVAQTIREESNPSDRLLVWGLAPEVYWEADRLPATRFVTTLSFLAGVQPSRDEPRSRPERANQESWDDFLADFDEHPPELILDTSPAALKDAELAPIRKYPSLAALVVSDYCFLREVRGMHLYQRHSNDTEGLFDIPPSGPLAPPCG